MEKCKKEWYKMTKIMALVVVILSGMMFPGMAMASAADGEQYEMTLWKFAYIGNSGGMTISYLGKDGVTLSNILAFDKDIYAGHETDPLWTNYDSAAPFLAYIKKNGKDSNIQRIFETTCYDPTILKALAGQGISMTQIGGTANPSPGSAIFPVVALKNVVGIGIAMDGSKIPLPEPVPAPIPEPDNIRLAGNDRYQTAKIISENLNSSQSNNVILVSGNNFPDALSASVLSKKLNAPILLVDSTVSQSIEAFNYINAHVPTSGTVYIIGGTAVISDEFETKLNSDGWNNVKRLGGYDRYDTDMLVVKEANVSPKTPVFVASGENFPDALSVASFAGTNQYPLLLAGQNYLSDDTKLYIANNKPSIVYIAGGTSVISKSIEDQIKALNPNASVVRLAGDDRFDTAAAVSTTFATNPQTIYLANGFNFPDALSGGALAAKGGCPILLVDHTSAKLPPAIEAYLKMLNDAGIHPNIIGLGGKVVVPYSLIQQAEAIVKGS